MAHKRPNPDPPAVREARLLQQAQMELLVMGFAVVKEVATIRGAATGELACPLCGQNCRFSISPSNGHAYVKCSRDGCISAME